jgi:GMP synthase PP-ATPase subunit
MKKEARRYGEIVTVACRKDKDELLQFGLADLLELQKIILTKMRSATRVLYEIGEGERKQPYVVAVRAVETKDFLEAKVADIPWSTLKETADQVLKECSNVSAVYYDVTPKPPATIEME